MQSRQLRGAGRGAPATGHERLRAAATRVRVQAVTSASAEVVQERKAVRVEPPYKVLITGSTKGVGRALADEFLKSGDFVVISSRSSERVAQTVAELAEKHGVDRVVGRAADVSDGADVRALAEFAKAEFGGVDMWINNAGSNAYRYGPLSASTDEDLKEIVTTNVLGVMVCCREAVQLMKDQPTGGHIFNMDGAGADGNATPRFAAYGATKRSLQQLGKSLQAELDQAKIKNVGVHNLSPGMVTTELLMSGADTPTSKFFINCLAEPAEFVAQTIVPEVRKVPLESVNQVTGSIQTTYTQFLTKQRAYSSILARILVGRKKNRFVQE